MNYKSYYKEFLADVFTPVQMYMRLREQYSPCLLLESSDYHTKENSFSILCCDVLESFEQQSFSQTIPSELSQFIEKINCQSDHPNVKRFNSVFGYSSYESVQSFETISLNQTKEGIDIPEMRYQFFRFILVFNHFNNHIFVIENCPDGDNSQMEAILQIIGDNEDSLQAVTFQKTGERKSNCNDSQFKELVQIGKHHCQIGDVFQVVLSRRFVQNYTGDNFTLYRALRSINPSPFSFYFDYGDFQIFGASPEAQILVRNGLAEIHPIAGTYKRTGKDDEDAKNAKELMKDEKENAEHIMLVDLARNDLSKNAVDVEVSTFKEVQFYSHVIHLVSKVTGTVNETIDSRRLFADTFPAGTLSGAPKYKAMTIIDDLEPTRRGVYGGAIGAFGLQGDVNHAIAIRTFVAKKQTLYYQAGAGVVIDSVPEKENQEVYNKLRALEMAMDKAEEMSI